MDVFADVLRGASVSVGTPQVTERYLVSDKTTNKKMKERERKKKKKKEKGKKKEKKEEEEKKKEKEVNKHIHNRI